LRADGLVVVKLGGSAITFKEKPMMADEEAIRRLAGEIAASGVERLVVVHGGGSFGHPLAHEYAIHEGMKGEWQFKGLVETHRAMEELNGLVVEALLAEGLPALPLPPVSCFITEARRIDKAFLEPVRAVLSLRGIPVLYGDVVLDEAQGFAILSGDQIVACLALSLGASRVVLGLGVDGVFDRDPTRHPDARLVERLRPEDIYALEAGGSAAVDVTGGMKRKLREMAPVAAAGIPVLFVNARKPGLILRALRGEKVKGTLLSAA